MKKLIFFIFFIILFVFLFFKKDKNARNMDRLKVGMTTQEVKAIMGEPFKIDAYRLGDDSVIGYYYLNNELGASGHYHVIFSHGDKKIVRIDFGT